MRTVIDPLTNETDWDFVAEVLDQFKKDTIYLNNHRAEWIEQHPDHWAVVFNEELAGVSPSLEEAMGAAEGKGIPCNLAAVELLSTKPYDLILCRR